MSGPLAAWTLAHADGWKLRTPARFVLSTLALDGRHDGTGIQQAVGEVANLTGLDRRTVQREQAALRACGALILETAGGGRGRAARYRIPIHYCGCWACLVLADVIQKQRQTAALSPGKGRHSDAVSVRADTRNSGSHDTNSGSHDTNSGPLPPTTDTGNGSPLKGETLPTGCTDAPSPDAPARPSKVMPSPTSKAAIAAALKELAGKEARAPRAKEQQP